MLKSSCFPVLRGSRVDAISVTADPRQVHLPVRDLSAFVVGAFAVLSRKVMHFWQTFHPEIGVASAGCIYAFWPVRLGPLCISSGLSLCLCPCAGSVRRQSACYLTNLLGVLASFAHCVMSFAVSPSFPLLCVSVPLW